MRGPFITGPGRAERPARPVGPGQHRELNRWRHPTNPATVHEALLALRRAAHGVQALAKTSGDQTGDQTGDPNGRAVVPAEVVAAVLADVAVACRALVSRCASCGHPLTDLGMAAQVMTEPDGQLEDLDDLATCAHCTSTLLPSGVLRANASGWTL